MPKHETMVLIVDDEQSTNVALQKLLAADGFDVQGATDARAALALVATSLPDVIVTDLEMPGMTGLQLLAALRERGVDAPVIVVTAMNDVALALEAIRGGAVDYLAKPVDADVLIFAVRRALRERDLVRESTVLRRHNEELAADAEQTLRAREALLSVAAHDLRGPLSTLLLAVKVHSTEDDAQAVDKLFHIVERAAFQMSKLVEDLLDFARIEGGSFRLELDSHDASAIVQEAMSALQPLAKVNGIELDAVVSEDFTVRCAFARIVQVLVNIASNALHVTARGRAVRIVVERHGDVGRFVVEDEGPGIRPDHLPHVFEHGFRASRGRQQGAGLGLAIASGIVAAHHGTIGVESVLGAGSRFQFEIPLTGLTQATWQVAAPRPS